MDVVAVAVLLAATVRAPRRGVGITDRLGPARPLRDAVNALIRPTVAYHLLAK